MEQIQDSPSSVLVVDDEPLVLRAMGRQLERTGYKVELCEEAKLALERVRQGRFDVLVSDLAMPGMSGTELLRAVRGMDADLPVILVTGAATVEAAIDAVEYGAFKLLTKPFAPDELIRAVARATSMYRLACAKRQAFALLGNVTGEGSGRASLEASFERALASLWVAFQPIIRGPSAEIYGYEALLRSSEPSLPHPGAVLDAAERLGGLDRLGRAIRTRAALDYSAAHPSWMLFLNLHPRDLLDESLYSSDSALARIADRVVLEITERASLDEISDVSARVARLRKLGYRIAVDDLGAGYAGLASFAQLEPDVVKLDMSLVRDVEASPTKQKLIRSMTSLCKGMGMLIVAEGIETQRERDTLVELDCDLMQGYRFAKPARPFVAPVW